ncbi:MAG: hypothetical protein LN588_03715 [Rickettsia endosymbiont of Bryobia graminum]|nr:hypothetical protein [Rickettsia endosymbiont of Bryobia graminum]
MPSPKALNNKIKKNSFDDLEIERIKKKGISSIRESIGSQDDLNVKSPKPSEEDFLAQFTKNGEIIKPKSRIRRFFSSISNSAIVNKVKSSVSWLLSTKVRKILTGKAVGSAITIVFATVTLSTVFPSSAPIVFSMAAVSLAAVAVQAVYDTYKTRSLRKLATESNLLVKNRGYIDKQQQLFKIDPSLEKVLYKQIVTKDIKDKQDKYKVDYTKEAVNGIKKVLVGNIPSIASTVASASTAATGNVVNILKTIKDGTMLVGSLSYAGYSEKKGIDLITAFKININNELKNQNIIDYKNLQELGKIVKTQEIQTMAMVELMRDKDYFRLTDQQKIEKFEKYKTNIAELKKGEDVKKEGYLDDLVKAHNPFYEQPNKLSEYTGLTKGMKLDVEKIVVIDSPLQRSVSSPNLPKDNAKKISQSQKGKKRDSVISL